MATKQDYSVIIEKNTLYVVATPIGNLGDMSQRAHDVLSSVNLIAAEDTRHSARLLSHFGISTPCTALHEHNERQVSESILERLKNGESVALISDAGTPLLSDPGFHLVRLAHQAEIRVVPIPGPSALLAALSASGLPMDCFKFIGFLSAKKVARCKQLEVLKNETCSLVFYESPHRILNCIEDMGEILGVDRRATIARELTKAFETIKQASLAELPVWMREDPNQQRGEFVIIIEGAQPLSEDSIDAEAIRVLGILQSELALKQAVKLTAEITGEKKNRLYQYAIEQEK